MDIPTTGHLPGSRDDKKTSLYLRGLHNHSGKWVTLFRVDSVAEGDTAVMRCNQRTQPHAKKAAIFWDHFSAFKVAEMTDCNWRMS